jgi:hypothetical protein
MTGLRVSGRRAVRCVVVRDGESVLRSQNISVPKW